LASSYATPEIASHLRWIGVCFGAVFAGEEGRMDPIHTNQERSSTDLSVVSELLSGSYDVRRDLGKSRTYMRFEAETDGKRATVLLLPIDCEGDLEMQAAVDARLRELRTLEHPTTAAVRRHGTRHGIPFVEHPPLAGRTLSEQLKKGPVGRERALTITVEILEALAYANARGFAHGALTPEDVVLVRDSYDEERAVIFGVGLTSIVREFGGRKTSLSERDPYAAPELIEGAPPSGRADVYSVGALLYRMITDEIPPPPPIVSAFTGNPLLPPDLEPLLIRALAPKLVDRYPSLEEMIIEVRSALNARRALSSRPPRRERKSVIIAKPQRSRLPWIAGAALLGAGAAAMAFALSGPAEPEAPTIVSSEPAIRTAPAPAPEPTAVPAAAEAPAPAASEAAATPAPSIAIGNFEVAEEETEDELDPAGADLPEELRAAAERIRAGEELSRADLAPLYRHAARYPEDPRGNLLLGDAFVEKGWYSDAIERYYSAHSADPAARRHALMLENLVLLTFENRHVADFAADAIADIYGGEAADAVAAAIASNPRGHGQLERLERLYARITR
jgi:serine/threonine protein kinase